MFESEARIYQNAVGTPDGTIVNSRHQFDKQEHRDTVTGLRYSRNGGLKQVQISVNEIGCEDLTLTSNSSIDDLMNKLVWGSFGKVDKDSRLPDKFRFVKIKDLETAHIKNILKGGKDIYPLHRFVLEMTLRERLKIEKEKEALN